MDLKRAIILGALVYILSLVVAGVLGVLAGPALFPAVAVAVTIVILVLLTLQYFKKVKPNAKEGFLFGLVAGIVGIVIDTIIMAAIAPNPFQNLVNPVFYGAVLMVIIIAVIVGAIKGRKIKA